MPNRENWKRSYKISIGVPTYKEDVYYFNITSFTVNPVSTAEVGFDSTTIVGDAIEMSNLAADNNSSRGFTFTLDTSRSSSTSSNNTSEKTTLQLFNVNKRVLDVINQEGCVVRVFAGYGEEVSLAYSGDVMQVIPYETGNDVIQKIVCKDGGYSLKNTSGTIDYDESVSEKDVILDLAGRFPDSVVGTTGLGTIEDAYRTGGYSFMGALAPNFDRMLKKNNLSCSRFNGRIGIVPYRLNEGDEDYKEFAKTNYTLPPDVIKAIQPSSDNGNKRSVDTKSKSGIVVNTFFLPVEVGQFITIPEDEETKRFSGTYLVSKIRTKLESKGAAWDVLLTANPVS